MSLKSTSMRVAALLDRASTLGYETATAVFQHFASQAARKPGWDLDDTTRAVRERVATQVKQGFPAPVFERHRGELLRVAQRSADEVIELMTTCQDAARSARLAGIG